MLYIRIQWITLKRRQRGINKRTHDAQIFRGQIYNQYATTLYKMRKNKQRKLNYSKRHIN